MTCIAFFSSALYSVAFCSFDQESIGDDVSKMYTVNQKIPTIGLLFVHNFDKCWPIFKITHKLVLLSLIYQNFAIFKNFFYISQGDAAT